MSGSVVAATAAALFLTGAAIAGAVTSKPDPVHGKALAERLCANCHLVDAAQQHANADIPTFREIGSKPGQTEGGVMAHTMLPKHPMPQIPLTKSELAGIAAYIMTLREVEER